MAPLLLLLLHRHHGHLALLLLLLQGLLLLLLLPVALHDIRCHFEHLACWLPRRFVDGVSHPLDQEVGCHAIRRAPHIHDGLHLVLVLVRLLLLLLHLRGLLALLHHHHLLPLLLLLLLLLDVARLGLREPVEEVAAAGCGWTIALNGVVVGFQHCGFAPACGLAVGLGRRVRAEDAAGDAGEVGIEAVARSGQRAVPTPRHRRGRCRRGRERCDAVKVEKIAQRRSGSSSTAHVGAA